MCFWPYCVLSLKTPQNYYVEFCFCISISKVFWIFDLGGLNEKQSSVFWVIMLYTTGMVRKQWSWPDQTKLPQSKHQYTTSLMFMKGFSIYKAIAKTYSHSLSIAGITSSTDSQSTEVIVSGLYHAKSIFLNMRLLVYELDSQQQ